MKILKFLVIPIFILIAFFSCKKDNSLNRVTNEESLSVKKEVSVSSRGFLIFNTEQDIVKFGKLLMIDNDEKLINELKSEGFKSRKINQTDLARNPNSIYSSIFNAQGLLQVNNVIMKITDNDLFIFTLLQENADAATMASLINEIFIPSKMNKINVDRDLTTNFSLIDFTALNPYGQLELLNSGIAGKRRPMFGSSINEWETTTNPEFNAIGQCVSYTTQYSQTTTYVFWIGFQGSTSVGNTVTNILPPSACR
jgi:hypothetical protein